MRTNRPTAAILAGLLFCSSLSASAQMVPQVPPHRPGTICFTPTFWCWAVQPGPPGARCACPSPYGPIAGVLG